MHSRRLKDISPKAYEHPADRAATAALQSIPGARPRDPRARRDALRARLPAELHGERRRGSGRRSCRACGRSWHGAIDTLDLADGFDVYVRQLAARRTHRRSARASRWWSCNSAAITLLDDEELQTVLAHEAGHILSDHVLYQTALVTLLQLSPLVRLPLLAGLPMLAVRSVLLEWFRAAELSADRAATLVNRDPLVTSRTLMVLASGLPSADLDLDAFLRQGQEYHEWDSAWDRLSRRVTELNLTHSYPVGRVAELTEWVRVGRLRPHRRRQLPQARREGRGDRRGRRGVPALPRPLPADLRRDERDARQDGRPHGRLAPQGRRRGPRRRRRRPRGPARLALNSGMELAAIRIFPVKSLAGVPVDEAVVEPWGCRRPAAGSCSCRTGRR